MFAWSFSVINNVVYCEFGNLLLKYIKEGHTAFKDI